MKKITAVTLLILVGCVRHDIDQPGPTIVSPTTEPTIPSLPGTSDAGNNETDGSDGSTPPLSDNEETDDGCGGPSAPKCGEGRSCLVECYLHAWRN